MLFHHVGSPLTLFLQHRSPEELRWQDYTTNFKNSCHAEFAQHMALGAAIHASSSSAPGPGLPAPPGPPSSAGTAPFVFGAAPAAPAFGAAPAAPAFGAAPAAPAFGAAPASAPAPAFGGAASSTPGGGFGSSFSPSQWQQQVSCIRYLCILFRVDATYVQHIMLDVL